MKVFTASRLGALPSCPITKYPLCEIVPANKTVPTLFPLELNVASVKPSSFVPGIPFNSTKQPRSSPGES